MQEKSCPILERTGDGEPAGRCWYYTGENGICPRHGDVREELARLPELTDEKDFRKE